MESDPFPALPLPAGFRQEKRQKQKGSKQIKSGEKKKGNKKTAAITEQISKCNSLLRAPPGTRTLDTLIKSQVLYQLS